MVLIYFLMILLLAGIVHQFLPSVAPIPTGQRSLVLFLTRLTRNWLPLLLYVVACTAIAGLVLEYFGLPKLFRDDGAGFGTPMSLLFSPAIWSAFTLSVFTVVIFTGAYIFESGDSERAGTPSPMSLAGNERYVLDHAVPFLLFVIVAQLGYEADVPVLVEGALAAMGAFIGFVAGIFLLRVCYLVSSMLAPHFLGFVVSLGPFLRYWGTAGGAAWVQQVNAAMLVFVLAQLLAVVLSIVSVWLLTSVAILTLFAFIALGYFLLVILRDSLRILLALFGLVVLVVVNGVEFKHRFDEVAGLYAAPGSAAPTLLDPIAVHSAWAGSLPPSESKPPIIVFALSGGGYRSTFWSAAVMDELLTESAAAGSEFEGAMKHVRMITGASGGMVAGAYYTVAPSFPPPSGILNRILDDIGDARAAGDYSTLYPINRDSLSPVAQHLVQRDLLKLVIPAFDRLFPMDRGEVLQRQWGSLSGKFVDLASLEGGGSRPSMVLSPMVLETGRQLLVSNLALPAGVKGDRLASHYPKVYEELATATAVRMSASFPYVAPAVSLPPPRKGRPVDAGYYDDFGLQVIAEYFGSPAIMAWVQEHTSGIVVVFVNAYADVGWATAPGPITDSRLSRALGSFVFPIEGAFKVHTRAGMLKDKVAIEHLAALYEARSCAAGAASCRSDWISVIEFQNRAPQDVAISWYLSEDGFAAVLAQLSAPHNVIALSDLKTLWQTLTAPPP